MQKIWSKNENLTTIHVPSLVLLVTKTRYYMVTWYNMANLYKGGLLN